MEPCSTPYLSDMGELMCTGQETKAVSVILMIPKMMNYNFMIYCVDQK